MPYLGTPPKDQSVEAAIASKVSQTAFDAALAGMDSYAPGDIVTSTRSLSAPAWRLCDGTDKNETDVPNLLTILGPKKTKVKLADPATGSSLSYACSVNGDYYAFGNNAGVAVYKRSGDTFTKLSNPPGVVGAPQSVAFSPDGVYLAAAGTTSPYLQVYKRTGDTFTLLTLNSTVDGGVYDVAWDPSGIYLSMCTNVTPFINVFKRSGDTFTKLTNPVSIPTGSSQGRSCAVSPDGIHTAVGGTNCVAIYKRTSDTVVKLLEFTDGIASSPTCQTFSPDGTMLAIGLSTSPFIVFYKRTGDTFTKAEYPGVWPASTVNGIVYSPDGSSLIASVQSAPNVMHYKRVGDIHVLQAAPWLGSGFGTANGAGFSSDGKYLAVAHTATPYTVFYKDVEDGSKVTLPLLTAPSSVAKTYIKT